MWPCLLARYGYIKNPETGLPKLHKVWPVFHQMPFDWTAGHVIIASMANTETESEIPHRRIRQLDDTAVHRIAAGEVVERPSSVIKELVENSLDAGATTINVAYADGGKTLIRVTDDGHGIPPDQLPLAVRNHATSKIDGSDLVNIHSLGFRGEALAAMGATGRLTVRSRSTGSPAAASIVVDGGVAQSVEPTALSSGTVVELTGLFRALPARLKFLRSDTAEAREINATVKRLAIAAPQVAFTLHDVSGGGSGRQRFRADRETGEPAEALRGRLRNIIGKDFVESAFPVDATTEGYALHGFVALPTYSRGAAVSQFLFVNGRSVKDRLFAGTIRGAYADLLSRDRHPAVALFLDCDPDRVDVNVHPAKAEVRFREPRNVRNLIFTGVREVLKSEGRRTSVRVSSEFIDAARPESQPNLHVLNRGRPSQQAIYTGFDMQRPEGFQESHAWPAEPGERPAPSFDTDLPSEAVVSGDNDDTFLQEAPFGSARAQLHSTYIVSETRDGMIIVDQHAAHERLVYERFKAQLSGNSVNGQPLLIPEIIELDEQDRDNILAVAEDLAKLRLKVEAFGGSAVCVREVPAILGEFNVSAMIKDICDQIAGSGQSSALNDGIDRLLSVMSCHRSIRAGRQLSTIEMNALLREMEGNPFSGQCNHGRPTYVELKLADIERLFGRR